MRTGSALALCFLLSCGGGGGGPLPDTRLTLHGHVASAAGAPVTGAEVLLGLSTGQTDAAGNFSFSNLLPGSYTLSLQTPAGDFDCRQIVLSSTATDFSFTLPPVGGGARAVSVVPELNSNSGALDQPLQIDFNVALNPASVSMDDVSITPDIGSFSIAVQDDRLLITPRLQLPQGQFVLVEVTGAISAASGDSVSLPLRWRFRTAATDTFPPRLVASDPSDGATNYPPNLGLSLEFSEPLGAAGGISAHTTPGATLTVRTAGRVLYITPQQDWQLNTHYTFTVSGVVDSQGNALPGALSLEFTTGDQPAPYSDRQPWWNGADDTIYFSSNRFHDYDIYSVRPDGTELTRLTSSPGDELFPTVSADGKLLAYQARGPQGDWDVFVVNLDPLGEPFAVTAPTFNDTQPTFSRTFTRDIVYVSDRSTPAGLFNMNFDGSNSQELDRTFGSDQTQPALHPLLDTQLLFTSNQSGSLDVWRKTVSAVDGSALNFNLTQGELTDEHSPAWSPDASFIVYISDAGGVDNLWLADAGGEFPRQVTQFSVSVSGPALSPVYSDSRCVLSLPNQLGGSDLVLVDLVDGGVLGYVTGKEVAD